MNYKHSHGEHSQHVHSHRMTHDHFRNADDKVCRNVNSHRVTSSGRNPNAKWKDRRKKNAADEKISANQLHPYYYDQLTYECLHEHTYEDDKPSNGTLMGSSMKFLLKLLLGLIFVYIFISSLLYNEATKENADCLKGCTKSASNKSSVSNAISSLANSSHATGLSAWKGKKLQIANLQHVVFFEKLLSLSQGNVSGWSRNTSRDSRMYILPDNITSLNQPVWVLKQMSNSSSLHQSKMTKDGPETYLLVIICSKLENFNARSAIRSTWGNETNYALLWTIFQNLSHQFENVNISDVLGEKRPKRDLTAGSESNENSLNFNPFESNRAEKVSPNEKPEITRQKRNALIKHLSESEIKNNIYLKDHLSEENELNNNIPDDPRFDNSVNNLETTPTEAVDSKILGNFEEGGGDDNKILDYYDYASEPSNIMRIPPKGEKYSVDDTMLKEIAEAKNLAKQTMNSGKPNSELPKMSLFNDSTDKNIDSILDNIRAFQRFRSNFSTVAKTPQNVKFLFLLGQPPNDNNTDLQTRIDEEASRYGDIIQESFIDSYNNLTLKSMMLLKWVINNCKDNVQYVMKTDDDMYINVPRLVEALQNKSKEFVISTLQSEKKISGDPNEYYLNLPKTEKERILKNQKLLMGDLICEAKPIRDTDSKWYTPKYMYPNKVYPKYLSGTGYVMSIATAESLFKAALSTPIFHLEDIYITGMSSKKAGIKPVDHPGFSYMMPKFDPCAFAYLITAHQMTPFKIRTMHNLLTKGSHDMLEKCEVKKMLTKKTSFLSSSFMSNPKSFFNGLIHFNGLGLFESKNSKLAALTNKKQKRPSNSCH